MQSEARPSTPCLVLFAQGHSVAFPVWQEASCTCKDSSHVAVAPTHCRIHSTLASTPAFSRWVKGNPTHAVAQTRNFPSFSAPHTHKSCQFFHPLEHLWNPASSFSAKGHSPVTATMIDQAYFGEDRPVYSISFFCKHMITMWGQNMKNALVLGKVLRIVQWKKCTTCQSKLENFPLLYLVY